MVCEMVAWFMDGELERIWKEVAVISGWGQGQVATFVIAVMNIRVP